MRCKDQSSNRVSPLIRLNGKVKKKPCNFLLDCAAMCVFIPRKLVKKWQLRTQQFSPALKVVVADGGTQQTNTEVKGVEISIGKYRGKVDMVVADIATEEIILGMPWLRQVNPRIDWTTLSAEFSNYENIPAIPAALFSIQLFIDEDDEMDNGVAGLTSDPKLNKKFGSDVPVWLSSVVEEFADVLSTTELSLPPNRECDHMIELIPGTKPIKRAPYTLAAPQLDALKKILDDLLETGLLRKSKSPWGFPIHLVKKKNGEYRMVIDLRALNEVTVKNVASLPRRSELFDRLKGANYFTKLDLKSGYNQIRMSQESIPLTAINTYFGHYEFLVMPFGLTNAPATFMQLMQSCFVDQVNKSVIVFFDDILIYSKTKEEHAKHVSEALEVLRKNKLFAQPVKCFFGQESVSFLGHRISAGGVAVDEEKIKAVRDWPVPSNVSNLRSFLGLAGYYRSFVPNFGQIACDLFTLTGKNQSWVWGEPQQKAFELLKAKLSETPILIIPDVEKPFVINTDASDYAVGAVLQQDIGSGLQPVGFMSKKLSATQCSYSAYEKELYAILCALNEWKHYLYESTHKTVIVTDHNPLQYVLKQKKVTPKLARWIDTLQQFNLSIIHQSGKKNIVADSLSRREDHDDGKEMRGEQRAEWVKAVLATTHVSVVVSGLIDEIKSAYSDDMECELILRQPKKYNFYMKDGLLLRHNHCIYVPNSRSLRTKLLREVHDAPTGGHLGISKTFYRLSEVFYWPGMRREVQEYCNSCVACQQNKHGNQSPAGLLQSIPIPDEKFKIWSIDLIGPLPQTSSGKDTIVTMVDKFSKLAHFFPTVQTVTAAELAEIVFKSIVINHGVPSAIVSDRDPRFTSQLWRALWEDLLKSQLKMSTSYHPETDGQTERMNKTIEEMLRSYVNDKGDDWDVHLAAAELAYNSSVNEASGISPFSICYGSNVSLPTSLVLSDVKDCGDVKATEFVTRWEADLEKAKESMKLAQQRQAHFANQSRRSVQYQPGDRVMFTTKNIRTKAGKLQSRYVGPFSVLSVKSPVNVELELPSTMRIHPIVHVSKLKPYKPISEDVFPNRNQLVRPPPVIDDEDGQFYEIEKVIGKRKKKKGKRSIIQYLVQWHGYPADEVTWISKDDFSTGAMELIDEFEAEQREKLDQRES
jgi:hypothetical protein